jgi:DNA repair protein RecO (recombination protein O)
VSASVTIIDSPALVLRRVEFAEADLIVTLFTREIGRVSALARAARKSRRRYGGALEPFFTLNVRLEERPGRDLLTLSEASLSHPRTALLAELSRLEAAGRALSWIRQAAPPRTAEPVVWNLIERLLDRLAEPAVSPNPERELAAAGLSLLAAFGWGVDFERCVSCGKVCPAGASAQLDLQRGGLVCRDCGGGRLKLPSETRRRLAAAAMGETESLRSEDVSLTLELVNRVFAAHAGVE